MLTVYSPDHRLQAGRAELIGGELVPCYEKPERAEIVLSRVREGRLGDVVPPRRFGRKPLLRVHDENFLEFLETAWESWVRVHGARGFIGIGRVEPGSGDALHLRPLRVLFPDGEDSP